MMQVVAPDYPDKMVILNITRLRELCGESSPIINKFEWTVYGDSGEEMLNIAEHQKIGDAILFQDAMYEQLVILAQILNKNGCSINDIIQLHGKDKIKHMFYPFVRYYVITKLVNYFDMRFNRDVSCKIIVKHHAGIIVFETTLLINDAEIPIKFSITQPGAPGRLMIDDMSENGDFILRGRGDRSLTVKRITSHMMLEALNASCDYVFCNLTASNFRRKDNGEFSCKFDLKFEIPEDPIL